MNQTQDLHAILRARAKVGEFPYGRALALVAGAHLLVLAALLFKPREKADTDAVQVTWVNLPPALANQSGGAEARTEGQETERVRRVDDVAAQQPVPKPSEQEDNPFAKAAKSVRSGENPDQTSTGKQVKASKSEKPNPVSTPGTAGAGNANGLGQGSAIPGLNQTVGVEGGVGLIHDTDQAFQYTWYLQQVQTRIVGNWQRLGGQGRVQIYFKITKGGDVEGARVEVGSGNGALDDSALMAVRRSTPLPPLPVTYGADTLGVRFWFSYVGN
ncbi:MAG TPA: TonB family protein [Holophagaceae bacterium]|nr:TonB family protein [Holophagaceae bacterium]